MIYSELSPEEQREVRRYVRAHPEMAPLLEETQAFAALLQDAHLLRADPPGDEALAYYIATRRLGDHPLPAFLQEAFARIEARLASDAPLRARYEALVGRIATLEAASDPVAQFERLTGHRIAQAAPPAADARAETGRLAARPPRGRRTGRWAMAAVVCCLGLYGVLALVSQAARSNLDRLAALEDLDADGLRLRSGVALSAPASAEAHYAQAVERLRDVRKHTLGLFPSYDQGRLGEAAGLLGQVVAQEPPASPLRAQAAFLLAKIHLVRNDADGARTALQAVLAGPGWKAPEARALLEALDAAPQ